VHLDTGCNTHDLLQCDCDGDPSLMPGSGTKNDNAVIARTSSKGFIAASEVIDDDVAAMEQDVCDDIFRLEV
jgi:hypothetical protein